MEVYNMYVKIKTDNQLMEMPMRYKASWDLRNDDVTQAFVANHDLWLIKQDTQCPEYDPETHYAISWYEEENGYAVQKWEIKEIED